MTVLVMTYIHISLLWFFCFAIVFPLFALLFSFAEQRFSTHASSLGSMFSGSTLRVRCLQLFSCSVLAVILAVGPTLGALTNEWLYAPAGLDVPVSWLWVLVPSALGGAFGALWFGWVYRTCLLPSSTEDGEIAE